MWNKTQNNDDDEQEEKKKVTWKSIIWLRRRKRLEYTAYFKMVVNVVLADLWVAICKCESSSGFFFFKSFSLLLQWNRFQSNP